MQFEGNINIFPNYTPDDAREVAGVVCSPDLVTLLMMAFLRAVFRQMQRKGWPMVWPTERAKQVQNVLLDGVSWLKSMLDPQLRKTRQKGVMQIKKITTSPCCVRLPPCVPFIKLQSVTQLVSAAHCGNTKVSFVQGSFIVNHNHCDIQHII